MFSVRHLAYTTVFLASFASSGSAKPDFNIDEIDVERQLASPPLPPAVEPITTSEILEITPHSAALRDRSTYLPTIVQEAAANGIPPALVDAVVRIESRYVPTAVGSVGEVGLMQVRPNTAALLGFQGSATDLAEPQTNLRYGVSYLAKAWRLAGGDLCRALMKYRAGHGAGRMSALSIEYCRRVRLHLAAVGASFTAGGEPFAHARRGAIQRKPAGRRTLTAAHQKRHEPGRSIQLRTAKLGGQPATKARITAVRARMSGRQGRRVIRLVRQGPRWTISQRPGAAWRKIAYR